MSEFVAYLHEVFETFGVIRSRKMFGGHGLYHNDLMFALVVESQIYLKVDAESIDVFKDDGLHAFEYTKNGKIFNMSYHIAPESIYDDPDSAVKWANLAFDAAARANKIKIDAAARKIANKQHKGEKK